MRQNYQDPLGMSKKFRQRLKMIELRWFTKFQRGFAKNFLVKILRKFVFRKNLFAINLDKKLDGMS